MNTDIVIISQDGPIEEDVSITNENEISLKTSEQDIDTVDIDTKHDESDLSSTDSRGALSSLSMTENLTSPNRYSSENSPIYGNDDLGLTSISPESVNANNLIEITEGNSEQINDVTGRESGGKEDPEVSSDVNQKAGDLNSADMAGAELIVTGISVTDDSIVNYNNGNGSPNGDSCDKKEVVVLTNTEVVDKTSSEVIQSDIILDINSSQVESNESDLSVVGTSRSFLAAEKSDLSIVGSQIFKSSSQLIEDPVQSVMKGIFNNQMVDDSSLYITPSHADDFTEGLDLNMELEEEIVRAIHGIEEFVLDTYDVES